MSDALGGLGYDVTVGLDLDRDEMTELLRRFVQSVPSADTALFYYAGHSIELDGTSYLLPVDADVSAASLLDEAIQLDEFLRYLGSDTRNGVAFIDGNRPSSSDDVGLPLPSGLGQVGTDTPNLIVGFATSPGQIALDGSGEHSPFAEALLRHLSTPAVTVGELMSLVQAEVYLQTGGMQQPWVVSSLSREFSIAGIPAADDLAYRQAVEASTRVALEEFIHTMPDSRWADVARTRLKLLNAPVADIAPDGPDLDERSGGGGAGGSVGGSDDIDVSTIFEEDRSFGGADDEVFADVELDGAFPERDESEENFPLPAPMPVPEPAASVPEPELADTEAPDPEPVIQVATLPAIEIVSPADRSGDRYVALADEIEVIGRITASADSVNLVVVDGEPVTVEPDYTFRRTVQLSGRKQVVILVSGAGGLLRWPIEFERPSASRLVSSGRNYALIIGNQDYDDDRLPDLRFPLADAAAVAKALRERFGFATSLTVDGAEVSLELHDPSLRDIERAMSRLRNALQPEDSLIIYYAGHGIWQEDIGLAAWLPRDAEPDFMSSMFRSDLLHSLLAGMKARKILVVSDSCYAGRMMRGEALAPSSEVEGDLAAQRQSRVFLAAGDREPVPDGGSRDGRNSLFAASFLAGLESMREDEFTALELFSEFIEPLVSSPDQEPVWSPIEASGHEGGDFIFVRAVP